MTLSGIQLATGGSAASAQMLGDMKQEQADPAPLAGLAFVCGVLGLGLGFVRRRRGAIAPAACGALGAVLLLLLKSKIEGAMAAEGQGIIRVEYEMGFYALVTLFLAAVALNIFFAMREKGPPPLPSNLEGGGMIRAEGGALPGLDLGKHVPRVTIVVAGLLTLRVFLGAIPMMRNASAIGETLLSSRVLVFAIIDSIIFILMAAFGLWLGKSVHESYKRLPSLGEIVADFGHCPSFRLRFLPNGGGLPGKDT